MQLGRIKRFLKFGVVGGTGVLVNMGILFLLTERGQIDYKISSIVAIETAIINNFLWNSFWTWSDRKAASHAGLLARFARFNISSGCTALLVNWGLLVILTEYGHLHYQLSNLIGIGCGTIMNFVLSHFWVFSNKSKGGSVGQNGKKGISTSRDSNQYISQN